MPSRLCLTKASTFRQTWRVPPLLRRLLWLPVCSTLLLTGCEQPAPAEVDLLRPVKTVRVDAASSAERLSQTGEIRPFEETSLGFRIDGRLLKRQLDVGAMVKPGDVIAELDPGDSQNQLNAAQAQLDSARSSEKLALANLNRIKQLLPGGAVSQAQFDQTQSAYEAAVSASQSALASLAAARDRLSFTRLTADKAGVISVVSANQGQVVAAGQEIVRLASLSGKDAVFDVAERLLQQGHQPGSPALRDLPVQVSLLSDPTVQTSGLVRDISPVADPLTRTYRVRVSLADAPAAFSFGTTVLGSIELPDAGAIVLPASALTRQGDTAAVYLAVPAGDDTGPAAVYQLKRQNVVISRFTDQQVFIASGLAGGEQVVVAGVSKLRPDQRVRLLPEQP